MARTTAAAVKLVMAPGKDYDTNRSPDLTPFIDTASAVVDRVAACATAKGITLSSTELELIERWLSAHFHCVSDKPYSTRSTQGASGGFHGQTAMALDATLYGQTAKGIDYSGCLAAIFAKQKARMKWLGKPPSEQVDYVNRD